MLNLSISGEHRQAELDRYAGMIVAAVILVIVFGLLVVFRGVPPAQDCRFERHGKGAFTARCVDSAAGERFDFRRAP